VRVFGIDPGSQRTGYGCVDSDGHRHRLVCCGTIRTTDAPTFPDRLSLIFHGLSSCIRECQPECVAVENVFHASNVRSALKLGYARGVALLAAVEAGVTIVEYTPAEVKRAVVGYGRAEKLQVQQMITSLLGLERPPNSLDASDALAVAICHLHSAGSLSYRAATTRAGAIDRPASPALKSWRHYKPQGRTTPA
jgi:crossover junction endodeoxyribonuclease RuvC